MHHCAILDGYLLIFKVKKLSFFLCSMWNPSSFEPPPPALEGGVSATGHWGSPWKGFLSLIMLFGLKQHQGNLRRTDSQQWKTLVDCEEDWNIFFSVVTGRWLKTLWTRAFELYWEQYLAYITNCASSEKNACNQFRNGRLGAPGSTPPPLNCFEEVVSALPGVTGRMFICFLDHLLAQFEFSNWLSSMTLSQPHLLRFFSFSFLYTPPITPE